MARYSIFSLLREGLRGHRGWQHAWGAPALKPAYDVVIIGGGGHGLATAYYLARKHGIRDVCVLEKGWIGGGNTGRNTTIVRSNYLLEANAHFYEHALKLWEGLSHELGFNVMFSDRGVLNLAHSDAQMDAFARRGNAMRLNGIDAELLSRAEVQKRVPVLEFRDDARFPIYGGLFQPRGGTVRHDAVAWGYAHAAAELGVHIVQNCAVTGIRMAGNRAIGVETSQGPVAAARIGIAVAGHTSAVARMAGLTLPIESHLLQAFVSEGIKPFLDTVVTFGAGHFYASQSDKGGLVMGGDLDFYNSYAQTGAMPLIEHTLQAGCALIPAMARLRLLRQWAGVMDMTMDGSPIIGHTPIDGLYLNGGWCYGGFKATPASGDVFAHTIAHDAPHALNAAFTLERFAQGRVLDEKGIGPFPQWH